MFADLAYSGGQTFRRLEIDRDYYDANGASDLVSKRYFLFQADIS